VSLCALRLGFTGFVLAETILMIALSAEQFGMEVNVLFPFFIPRAEDLELLLWDATEWVFA
jgi:hypothetical protein